MENDKSPPEDLESTKSASCDVPHDESLESKAVRDRIREALTRIISEIPTSNESVSQNPEASARKIASQASARAAMVSGGLALPPGPAGLVTILPDIIVIWKIQRQMIADIAATFDHVENLDRQQMLYCLFKHVASQAVRDVVVRVGQRYLVRRASLRMIQGVLRKVGIKTTQRIAGKVISRWLPIVGAVGVGAYAYYDTAQVATTAIELFDSEIDFEKPRSD